jgi:SPOR domain
MNPTGIETQPAGDTAAGMHETERPDDGGQAGGITATAARRRPQQQFLLCEHCQAPVDRDQRYCVSCGARQSHARNPATSYFALAARSRRTPGPLGRTESALRGPWFVLFLLLLPIGVGVGVLVGRSGSGTNNDKLIAALQKQQPVVASPSSGTSATSEASAASGGLSSDFSLPRGFAIQLSTLPTRGTDQAAVTRAKQEARSKGAGKVGLINPKDFKTSPSAGTSNYVIYSGEFKTKAEATKALAKLRSHFPAAKVIQVSAAGSASAARVVAHTAYGEVHEVAGSKATPQQLQQDKQIVQKINRTVGKSYVKAQQNLPDVIPVPSGAGGGSSPSTSAIEKLGEK